MSSAFGDFSNFSKKPEKMTLAERQKAAEQAKAQQKQQQQQQWAGIDSLGSFSAPKSSAAPRKPLSSAPQGSNLDLLGGFGSSSAQESSRPAQKAASSSILDDFDVFTSAPAVNSQPLAAADPFADFEEALPRQKSSARPDVPAASHYAPSTTSKPAPQRPAAPRAQTVNDASIAQLVDMGFTDHDAARALEQMDGSVKGAINYLMAEAQGRPLPKPKQKSLQQDDVMAMAQEAGATMFAAASSWWSKGRKQLQKTMDTYQGQPSADGQPAWMRSQAKHMQKETQIRESPGPEDARMSPAPQFSAQPPSESPAPPSARHRTFNEELPQRRRDPPRTESPASGKSRAELFREKQAQRSSQTSRVASPAPSGSTTHAPEPASAPAASPASASPAPEIDLLGMTSSAAAPALSSTQADMVATSRTAGTDAFKRGDYSGATNHYTSALQSIPKGHMLRTVLLSNRSAALLKVGDAHGALSDTKEGLEIIGKKVVKKDSKEVVEEGKPLSEIWVKLVVRQAQAYEHLEKHPEAMASWTLLLDNGYSNPTHLDGKRRCQAAINQKTKPAPKPVSDTTAAPPKKSQRRGWGTTGAGPSSAEGRAAVEKVRSLNRAQEQSDKERGDLLESVSVRIEAWRKGKEDDLRALLSTIQNVLWKECQWTPVASADLVSPKKARIVYMKAVAKTHPDKIPSTASTEVKMISESIFITLNKAWEGFREANGL